MAPCCIQETVQGYPAMSPVFFLFFAGGALTFQIFSVYLQYKKIQML